MQLTGRLDWRTRLAESDLSAEAASAVLQVVQKTRLFRLEKSQVCDELIAHFEDGQRSGQSYQKILDEFGDINETAVLISRSKKRNRSMFLKIGRIAGYLSLGALASYIAISIYFFLGQPKPSVDFMQDLNATAISQPEEDKAWPIYRETWIKHNFCDNHFPEVFVSEEQGPERLGKLLTPDDASWPAAVAFLQEHRDMLAAFRAAGRKPALGLELKSNVSDYSARDALALVPGMVDENGEFKAEVVNGKSDPGSYDDYMANSLIHVLLPHVQSFRSVAQLLKIDTRLAIEENDPDRAVANILATFGVAKHSAECPILVCGLVALAVSDLGLDQIEEAVMAPDFLSPDQIESLQQTVSELPLRDHINFAGERAMMYDILQRVYTDDGDGDGRMTSQGIDIIQQMHAAWGNSAMGVDEPVFNVVEKVVGPVSLIAMASRKEMKRRYDELMDEAEVAFNQPIATYEMDIDQTLTEASQSERFKYYLIDILFPGVESIRHAMEARMARRDAVELALAAYRFKKASGDWPTAANQLVPKYIESLPVDPLTGGPLSMAFDDNRLKIYSFGNNLQDDDGQPLTNQRTGEKIRDFRFQSAEQTRLDGDWILWPQQKQVEL